MRAFLKRLIGWLFLAMPVGLGLGALVSAFLVEGADRDRFTSAVNGVIAGFWLALLGAVMTAAITTATRDRLRAAGGSELLTGAIISYGLIFIGLGVLAFG